MAAGTIIQQNTPADVVRGLVELVEENLIRFQKLPAGPEAKALGDLLENALISLNTLLFDYKAMARKAVGDEEPAYREGFINWVENILQTQAKAEQAEGTFNVGGHRGFLN